MTRRLLLISTLAAFTLVFWAGPAFLFSEGGPLESQRLGTRDALFAMRRASADLPAEMSGIAVIAIDDESCARLGARWPWSRQLIEKLVSALARGGAKVIALNLSFSGLENGEESTRLLAQALESHGHVVLGATFGRDGRLLKPHPILSSAAESGFLEKIVDADYRIRRSYLLRPLKVTAGIPSSGSLAFFEGSFPLKVASQSLGAARLERRLGGGLAATIYRPDGATSVVPLDSDGSYPINYLAGESDFKVHSAWKAIEGKLPGDALSGKVAFVGLASTLFSEKQPTPLGPLHGVFLHANEYLSIASGRFLHFAPPLAALLFSWLASLAILALWVLRRFVSAIAAAFVALVAGFFGAQFLFSLDWVVEPFDLLFGPVLAVVFGVASNLLSLLLENKGLETKVIRDKMTGLYTYEHLRARLDDEWKRCQKLRLPVAIAMTDLDRFKKINDTLGHEVGNQMILRAAEVIRQSVRGYDVVSRYGGDEFVVLLWHSSLAEAKAYRDRLRTQYHAMAGKLDDDFLKTSSISIGVAAFDPNDLASSPKTPQELVEIADKDLFSDKESRRKPGEASR